MLEGVAAYISRLLFLFEVPGGYFFSKALPSFNFDYVVRTYVKLSFCMIGFFVPLELRTCWKNTGAIESQLALVPLGL